MSWLPFVSLSRENKQLQAYWIIAYWNQASVAIRPAINAKLVIEGAFFSLVKPVNIARQNIQLYLKYK